MKTFGGYGAQLYRIKNPFYKLLLSIFYPPAPFINCISNHQKEIIKRHIFTHNARVLDIGSGISKGPGKWLWANENDLSITVVRMDICAGPTVDVVCDATKMPADIGLFDSVVLQSVPEHIQDIFLLFKQIDIILKPNGYIYIEMPFLQGMHGDPSDYWRTTNHGLAYLVNNYDVVLYGVSGGPVGSLNWIISDLLSNIFTSDKLNLLVRFLTRWLLSPLRYLDLFLLNKRCAERLACENFILAKK